MLNLEQVIVPSSHVGASKLHKFNPNFVPGVNGVRPTCVWYASLSVLFSHCDRLRRPYAGIHRQVYSQIAAINWLVLSVQVRWDRATCDQISQRVTRRRDFAKDLSLFEPV